MPAIAVGGLADERVGGRDARWRAHDRVGRSAEVAGEHQRALATRDAHDRGAEQVAGAQQLAGKIVTQIEAGLERHDAELPDRAFGVVHRVERFGRRVLGQAMAIGVPGLVLLQVRAVAQQDLAQLRGGLGGVNRSAKSVANQRRQVAAVIEVRVAEHDRMHACRGNRELRAVAQSQLLVALEQAAVEKHPPLAGIEQVARTGDGAGGPGEGEFRGPLFHRSGRVRCK